MRLQYGPIVLADVVGAQTIANARRPLDTHPLASDKRLAKVCRALRLDSDNLRTRETVGYRQRVPRH